MPAIIGREILIRIAVVNGRSWLNFLLICTCLAISASYELLEWGVAVWNEDASESFSGTQGDRWDTQSDIAFTLLDTIAAIAGISRLHDAQFEALPLRPEHRQ